MECVYGICDGRERKDDGAYEVSVQRSAALEAMDRCSGGRAEGREGRERRVVECVPGIGVSRLLSYETRCAAIPTAYLLQMS